MQDLTCDALKSSAGMEINYDHKKCNGLYIRLQV